MASELYATLTTSLGPIRVKLFPDHAPKTVQNFVGLADGSGEWTDLKTGKKGEGSLYAGTVFHRVINGFMIQGGDPLGTGTGGPGYRFKDEFHPELRFDRPYLLAMANAGPGTNGSQFFITVGPTPHLNMKHTIFGEVADQAGRDTVDKIATTPTGRQDRPVTDVVIESIAVERGDSGPIPSRSGRRWRPPATATPTARPTSGAPAASGRSARTTCARRRSASSARSAWPRVPSRSGRPAPPSAAGSAATPAASA